MATFVVTDVHGRENFALFPGDAPDKVDLKPVVYKAKMQVDDSATLTRCIEDWKRKTQQVEKAAMPMKQFTVIIGDFEDFPGVWNEVHVTCESINEVDVEAAARKAFDELSEEQGAPLPSYTLVGIYPGHLINEGF